MFHIQIYSMLGLLTPVVDAGIWCIHDEVHSIFVEKLLIFLTRWLLRYFWSCTQGQTENEINCMRDISVLYICYYQFYCSPAMLLLLGLSRNHFHFRYATDISTLETIQYRYQSDISRL